MTLYKHRLVILTHRARQKKGNQAAADWDPDVGGHRTFETMTMARRGQPYPVFAIANTAATDEMKEKILAAEERGDVDVVWDITGEEDEVENRLRGFGVEKAPDPPEDRL